MIMNVKYGDSFFFKGASTSFSENETEVNELGDARSLLRGFPSVTVSAGFRNSANNAWNVNFGNGNVNNNNTYNRYAAPCVSELEEKDYNRFLIAEESCYKNKHDSFVATRIHFNLHEVKELADKVYSHEWSPGTASVFAVQYPTPREVWAADYPDRILHHDIAPVLIDATEKIHEENGNVSHGNRSEHSAYTAALQVQSYMKMLNGEGFVGKRDISGFFMGIRRELAWKIIEDYVTDHSKDDLIEIFIKHDPTKKFILRSSVKSMSTIPTNKSAFNAKEGYAFPLGNFYSQLLANIVLHIADRLAKTPKYLNKVFYSRFVDDMCAVSKSAKLLNEFFNDIETIIFKYELKINSRKKYIQPIRHGVKFCGYFVYANRIYISNRTRNACEYLVKTTKPSLDNARKLVRSLNSYFGFFSKCNSMRIQMKIAADVHKKFGKYITERVHGNQIIFSIANKYKEQMIVLKNFEKIKRRNMKVGKYIDNEMVLVEVENGKEVTGDRTEQELYNDGYEKVCEVEKPSDDAVDEYIKIENGYVQNWKLIDEWQC